MRKGGEIEISDSKFARLLFPELARGGKITLNTAKLQSLANVSKQKKNNRAMS